MKKKLFIFSTFVVILAVFFQFRETGTAISVVKTIFVQPDLINKKGDSVSTRVKVPDGYSRVLYPRGSFQEFIQNYKLKPFGAKVINYNGVRIFLSIRSYWCIGSTGSQKRITTMCRCIDQIAGRIPVGNEPERSDRF